MMSWKNALGMSIATVSLSLGSLLGGCAIDGGEPSGEVASEAAASKGFDVVVKTGEGPQQLHVEVTDDAAKRLVDDSGAVALDVQSALRKDLEARASQGHFRSSTGVTPTVVLDASPLPPPSNITLPHVDFFIPEDCDSYPVTDLYVERYVYTYQITYYPNTQTNVCTYSVTTYYKQQWYDECRGRTFYYSYTTTEGPHAC